MVAKEGGLWNVVEGNSGNFAFEQDLKIDLKFFQVYILPQHQSIEGTKTRLTK